MPKADKTSETAKRSMLTSFWVRNIQKLVNIHNSLAAACLYFPVLQVFRGTYLLSWLQTEKNLWTHEKNESKKQKMKKMERNVRKSDEKWAEAQTKFQFWHF